MKIPIKSAKDIAKNYGWDQVIIVAWNEKRDETHVTTFGKSLNDCAKAAMNGNLIKKNLLGWPDEQCQAKPRRLGGEGR